MHRPFIINTGMVTLLTVLTVNRTRIKLYCALQIRDKTENLILPKNWLTMSDKKCNIKEIGQRGQTN